MTKFLIDHGYDIELLLKMGTLPIFSDDALSEFILRLLKEATDDPDLEKVEGIIINCLGILEAEIAASTEAEA